jgi:hypothetical protein
LHLQVLAFPLRQYFGLCNSVQNYTHSNAPPRNFTLSSRYAEKFGKGIRWEAWWSTWRNIPLIIWGHVVWKSWQDLATR